MNLQVFLLYTAKDMLYFCLKLLDMKLKSLIQSIKKERNSKIKYTNKKKKEENNSILNLFDKGKVEVQPPGLTKTRSQSNKKKTTYQQKY